MNNMEQPELFRLQDLAIVSNVEATIEISMLDECFSIVLTKNRQTERFHTILKPHDLQHINMQLQQALSSLSDDTGASNFEDNLFRLAEAGYAKLLEVFEDNNRDYENNIERLSQMLQDVNQVEIIDNTDNFSIPWELLYSNNPYDNLDYSNFWGMRFEISNVSGNNPPPKSRQIGFPFAEFLPFVGLITDLKLDHVRNIERPFIIDHHMLESEELTPLMPANKKESEIRIRSFFKKRREIYHFACHGDTLDQDASSYLCVSNNFHITTDKMRISNVNFYEYSIVILNACRTGIVNPLYSSNWAQFFSSIRARGVIATSIYVPDEYAAAFIKEVYHNLLSKKTVANSLKEARRKFFDENNPIGLAYTLYGPIDLVL